MVDVNNITRTCKSNPAATNHSSKCLGPECTLPPVCSIRADNSLNSNIKPQTIGPVRDLRSSTSLDKTVLLSWRPPIEGHECIKEYLITWGSESETIPAPSTFYYVTDLEPCMRYNFTVNTIDQSNDKGTPATIEDTVREENQLSEVTELELNEVEPRSLTVKWKAPVNGTYCVGSYRLAAWYNDPQTGEPITVFSNTTDDQHVTFGEVIACMTYTVQVIPISFSNKDGRNDIGTLKTKERTILSYHIEPIRALSIKARSLQLSTQLLGENNNNCLLVSVRFSCSKDGEIDPESQIVREFVISGNESFEGIVEPLVPFTSYECTAQIQNIAGWSDATPAYVFHTAEDVPESPRSLKLVGDRDSIAVAWKAPTVKNGVVVRYRIHVRMVEQKYPIPKICDSFEEYNETVDLRDEVEPEESRSWDGDQFEYTITRLSPFTLYTVQVAAATGAGVGSYTEPQDVVTLPSVPEAVQNFAIAEIEGPELNQTNRSAVKLSWQLPCRLHGNLTGFVGRLYGTREEDGSPPHELTWNVGVQANEINDTYFYVEDRLKPEYIYTVSISVEVADVAEQSPETTISFQSPAGITVAVVLLAVWLKPYCSKQWCRENNALQKKETSGISVKKFRGQYAQIYESNQQGKIKDEYESIVQYQDHNFNATARSGIANDSKNRYDDILPFDFNRVQLETEESDEGIPRDYINASFIDGYTNRREYIATQGPFEETCYDFWRMVFQYDVESIVMLIQPSGEDKNKCCQYYPLLNRNMEYEDIEVRCTQEINLSFYCRRKFTVYKGNVSKIVSQYHFLDWLTQGCPTSPSNLIDFIKIVRRERKNNAIPLVVHCSAGVGRTGTFIALDIILQRMEKEQQICVYSTVKELRRKRVHMVQTLDQYAFLYRCCLDFTANKDLKG
ncbi:receptor-type tyrosine-protein phosphatase H-like [Anopheles ziemanni]|uniref:receptor-type tyrosine-protein phosphatase H-like n=1 Tax=Anopheles coustani TaxID=139045 RepID=UPI00265A3EEC|nr:receptor-type tyrosine-protein phosphatase H-like [Anopheles coustani]XP_058170432.1 receptor-type tyrosine-protein phosphatase H-like [Anopheles ziemanni]